jgi:hypothetical protein
MGDALDRQSEAKLPDPVELTPSRLLLLFNAWENPGAYLFEIVADVIVKGGSDAVIGLGFEVYVAEVDRTHMRVEEDLAWAVSNDLIKVGVEDVKLGEPIGFLSVPDLRGLPKHDHSDVLVPLGVRVGLTQQGVAFWNAIASTFPMTNMGAGKTRLIPALPKETGLGLFRWAPEKLGITQRLRLRLWRTTPRKDLVRRPEETSPYTRKTNTDARIMEGRDAWGSPEPHRTVFGWDEPLENRTKNGFILVRTPLFGHWISARKEIIPFPPAISGPNRVGRFLSLLRRHSE